MYTIYRYENGSSEMNIVFRDHTISDLIGFVYSGMPASEAAQHLVQNIQRAAQPILDRGQDAVLSIILDGENAWEYYPKSGREFLRRFYDKLQTTPGIEAVTISEAIARHRNFGHLASISPGSWISANFNVWIGAPEDNRSWDYLYQARHFYDEHAPHAPTLSANWRTRNCLLPKAATGTGGTGRNTTRPTIATSTSFTASICPTSIRHWAPRHPTT